MLMGNDRWFFSFICIVTLLLLSTTAIHGQCGPSSWQCSTGGDCIDAQRLCDGRVDCPDASDEISQTCIARHCPSYAFRCVYGACVSRRAECDGVQDCADNSDELTANCAPEEPTASSSSSKCGQSEFGCTNGECIAMHRKCDGKAECTDGSDEVVQLCAGTYCPSYGFRCGYGACVHGRSKCNGELDCVDGSDENNALCGGSSDGAATATGAQSDRCTCVVPLNGQVFYEQSPTIELSNDSMVEQYTSILYKCRPGWNLLGSSSNICVSGSWTYEVPSCLKYCSPETILSESTVAQCEYQGIPTMCHLKMLPGTIARVSCAFGYRRVPDDRSDITVCGNDGYWDRQVLNCEQICGQLADRGVAYVVGGERTNNTKVPWHAGIYNDLGEKGKFMQSCGGTILSNRVVVSAAHCFWDQGEEGFYDMKHFQVVVGKYYRDWNAAEPLGIQKISVERIENLPEYRDYEKLYTADIALLVLAEAIVFRAYVVPICMEYNLKFNEQRVTGVGLVAGWGLTVSGGTPSAELKVLNMPAIDVTQCENTVPGDYARFVTSDKFCAGYTNGQSVCQGDSGGGLVFMKTVNGKTLHYLRGIVSSGPRSDMSCASDTYSVFTNVHYYGSFIAQTVLGGNKRV